MESQRRILRFLFAIIGGVTFILLLTYQPTKSTHHTIKVDSSRYYKTELKKLKKELARQKELLKTKLQQ
ncbi:MAG TPA: hypothetical protein DCS93_40100 [Microscillaceae bacterium]|nr:hypothetical protein [Microscillaceae bacterium]